MKRNSLFVLFSLAASLVANLATAEVKSIELPAETAAFKPGKGVETAMAYCSMCHSADYITSQPTMPRAFWEAEVLKMKNTYGAPVPDAAVPELVEYLTTAYGKK